MVTAISSTKQDFQHTITRRYLPALSTKTVLLQQNTTINFARKKIGSFRCLNLRNATVNVNVNEISYNRSDRKSRCYIFVCKTMILFPPNTMTTQFTSLNENIGYNLGNYSQHAITLLSCRDFFTLFYKQASH